MLKEIEELAKGFSNVEEVKAELKKIQSIKCRLKKQKDIPNYEGKMTEVVTKEQALKEVRQLFEPKKVTYTTMTVEQISQLNYDETIKAIKSVQSKKCNAQYLEGPLESNVEYQQALKQESLLLEHKNSIKPIEDTVIKKSSIVDMIDHIETLNNKIDKNYVLELLKGLL